MGKYGTIPELLEDLSKMILLTLPNTFSMVSKYILDFVTSGAFL